MRKAKLVILLLTVIFLSVSCTTIYAAVSEKNTLHIEPTSKIYVYDDSGKLISTYQAIVLNIKADGSMDIYDCEKNSNLTLMNSMIYVDTYSDRQLTANERKAIEL